MTAQLEFQTKLFLNNEVQFPTPLCPYHQQLLSMLRQNPPKSSLSPTLSTARPFRRRANHRLRRHGPSGNIRPRNLHQGIMEHLHQHITCSDNAEICESVGEACDGVGGVRFVVYGSSERGSRRLFDSCCRC